RWRSLRAQVILEQQARGTGVGILGAPPSCFDRRVALVVQLQRDTDRRKRGREAAHPLGLRPDLATERQWQTDDKAIHLLTARDRGDPLDVRIEASRSAEGRQRATEAERVIPDRETDPAVADV